MTDSLEKLPVTFNQNSRGLISLYTIVQNTTGTGIRMIERDADPMSLTVPFRTVSTAGTDSLPEAPLAAPREWNDPFLLYSDQSKSGDWLIHEAA